MSNRQVAAVGEASPMHGDLACGDLAARKDNSGELYQEERAAHKVGITKDDFTYPEDCKLPAEKLLCKRIHLAKSSGGAIFVPQITQQGPGLFMVCLCGADVVDVEAGDVVAMPHYAGFPMPLDGELFYFVDRAQVNCIFPGKGVTAYGILKNSQVVRSESGD